MEQGSAREAWRAAVCAAAAQAREKYRSQEETVNAAEKIVLSGDVQWHDDGAATVTSQSDPTTSYTEGHRQEMDVLELFLEACCVLKAYASVKASLLYQAYQQWCEASGESPMSQRTLGLRWESFSFNSWEAWRNSNVPPLWSA